MEQREKMPVQEKTAENLPEMAPQMPSSGETAPVLPPVPAPPIAPSSQPAISDKDEELLMIENILSEDVLPIYSQLSDARKQVFKQKGEETALKIKIMLKQAKIRAHEVFELIKKWLQMLPKISTLFLEQEAKIKTDKVLQLKKEGQEIER
ncbi:MAG: hypothetical protein V1661_02825 [bacterium]